MAKKPKSMKNVLHSFFSEALGIPRGLIEMDHTFDVDFGMDGREKTSIRSKMIDKFGVTIPPALWKEYNTIQDVLDYFRQVGKSS